MRRLTCTLLAIALTLPATLVLAVEDYPPAIQHLTEQGVEIIGKFPAPGGLTGYAARADGRALILYATPDGKQVIAGTMLDATGRNLTEQHVRDHAPPPDLEAAWTKLERATWIAEGAAKPDRIIYTFTDPNCPYCNSIWRASRPYLDEGVQLRHIMVGIIRPSSLGKAAAILSAASPAEALDRHERAFDQGGIPPLAKISDQTRAKLQANGALMEELGLSGTPATYYRDSSGRVRLLVGMPSPEVLAQDIFQLPRQPSRAAQSAEGAKVQIEAEGQASEGLIWGKGDHGVVLAHGAIYDAASWAALATEIAANGMVALAVERIDASTVIAAGRYLRDRHGVKGVALLGASAGGSAAMQALRQTPGEWDQLIVLSATGDTRTLGEGPKLFIASEGEGIADSIRRMALESPGSDNEAAIVGGSAHAQAIFKTDQGPRLTQIILDRLTAARKGSQHE